MFGRRLTEEVDVDIIRDVLEIELTLILPFMVYSFNFGIQILRIGYHNELIECLGFQFVVQI
jgi:hypothetical protein